MSVPYQTIITLEPGKRSGKPTIRGLRITVYDVLIVVPLLAERLTKSTLATRRGAVDLESLPRSFALVVKLVDTPS